MLPQPRLDAPGAPHHVLVRRLERRGIFRDDTERTDFGARLAALRALGALTASTPGPSSPTTPTCSSGPAISFRTTTSGSSSRSSRACGARALPPPEPPPRARAPGSPRPGPVSVYGACAPARPPEGPGAGHAEHLGPLGPLGRARAGAYLAVDRGLPRRLGWSRRSVSGGPRSPRPPSGGGRTERGGIACGTEKRKKRSTVPARRGDFRLRSARQAPERTPRSHRRCSVRSRVARDSPPPRRSRAAGSRAPRAILATAAPTWQMARVGRSRP